ncbi:UTRA domain-containing protein [Streptomyces sp. NPDC006134]|uniref:UTRA domain-containing protein n=1 Tax=Streptomyces sp. NPDC006134 TaxID=3154467 RepID=UPI0033ED6C8F
MTCQLNREQSLADGQLAFHAEYEQIEAPEDLAAALNLEPGDAVLKRTYRTYRMYRTRSVNEDEPLNVARSYIPYEIAQQNPDLLDPAQEPWPGGTMNQLHTVGIEIDRFEEVVTARPPPPRRSRSSASCRVCRSWTSGRLSTTPAAGSWKWQTSCYPETATP